MLEFQTEDGDDSQICYQGHFNNEHQRHAMISGDHDPGTDLASITLLVVTGGSNITGKMWVYDMGDAS